MNALATVAMTDPHGKVSEFIRFTIDYTSDPFVSDDVMVIGRQYMFSLWIMSEANAAGHSDTKNNSSISKWE